MPNRAELQFLCSLLFHDHDHRDDNDDAAADDDDDDYDGGDCGGDQMFVKWRRAPVSQHQQQVNSPAGAHLLLVIIIILKVRAGHSTKKEATAHSWTHISKMALEERLGACSNCICCYICLCANVLQTCNNRCIATALLQYSVAPAAVLEHDSLYTFAKANNYSHIFWELQLHCWFDCCVSS